MLAHFEPFELVLSDVLCEPGKRNPYVYFPTSGFISLVAVIEGTPGVEVGMIGDEGMLGAELALGIARSPLHSLVQGAGTAWRAEAEAFRTELASNLPLRELLNRYIYVLMAQLATSTACMRFHPIGPRLARWLLMSHDRAHSDRFRVTHEFLSFMLGVRRVGITIAAAKLQRDGLIHYRRGDFTVIDRAGLERASCSCYSAGLQFYSEAFDRRGARRTGVRKVQPR